MTPENTILDHAEALCKSHGSRLTQKRKLILQGLLETKKALSAYELADHCAENHGQKLPVMSVYRILDFLQQEQLVHKLNLANKYVACSHITCSHSHDIPQFLICNTCQKVSEIAINKDMIDELQANVSKAGYHLESPQLEMNCLCAECKETAAN